MYDNICKYLAENFSEDLASWLLGEPIQLTELQPAELNVDPIRADSLILLNNDNLILHLEFQTRPDEKMAFRMLDYRVRAYRRFPNKAMRQIVIYLKESDSALIEQNFFEIPNLSFRFDIIKLWKQPTEVFLNSSGLLPFAALTKTLDPAATLQTVSQTLEQITPKVRQNDIAACTEILAGLILDKQFIRQILKDEIMKESVIYQDIFQQGKQEGKQEGTQEEKLMIAVSMLQESLPVDLISKVTRLPVETIRALANESS